AYLELAKPHSHYWIIVRLLERISLNLRGLSLLTPSQLYISFLSDAIWFRLFQKVSYDQHSYYQDVYAHLHEVDDVDHLAVNNDLQNHKQHYQLYLVLQRD